MFSTRSTRCLWRRRPTCLDHVRQQHSTVSACKSLNQGKELIAERQKLICIPDQSELGWSMVAEYNTEKLADDSKDKKRLEEAEQSAEWKSAKWKKKCVKPAAVHRGTHFVSNPATGSAASLGMQTGYQVPGQPGMICCSCHCNAKNCSFCSLCC